MILNFVFNVIEVFVSCEWLLCMLMFGIVNVVGYVELCVIDNGLGIEVGVYDWLFDGFLLLKVGGNGIGLLLCKSIVMCYGGWIVVSLVVGGGFDCCVMLLFVDVFV